MLLAVEPLAHDPDYPYPDGSIGVWGYDLVNEELVSPDTPDLMSYCHPQWISDYNFSKALSNRILRGGSQGRGLRAAVKEPPPLGGRRQQRRDLPQPVLRGRRTVITTGNGRSVRTDRGELRRRHVVQPLL